MRQPERPNIGIVAAVIATLVIAACGDDRPSDSSPSLRSTPRPTVAASPNGESPSAVEALEIDTLPSASLDPATETAVCDNELRWLDEKAGDVTISCFDGLVLGLQALKTTLSAPIERLYFQRPPCKTAPCTEDQLSTATVTGWTGPDAFSVALDSRLETVGMPTPDPDAIWPLAGSSPIPAVDRPVLKGAPAEIALRTAYPYCGRAEIGQPESVMGCFRDAVLAGRRAELLERVFGTEGGEITRLYRFDGRGALLIYQYSDGGWFRQAGSMILGFTPGAFDFEPWWGTEVRF